MTDAQMYTAVGLPMISLALALILNIVQISGIRRELDMIRRDIQQIRDDIRMIVGKLAELDTRLSVLEERLKR